MRFFSYDSKFSQFMLKFCNCRYLSLLWMLCALPVFTAGAATAALYDVTLRIARNEDPPVTSRFFKAFRANFRQATVLWLILLALGLLLGLDGFILYRLYKTSEGLLGIVCTIGLALIIVAAVAYAIVLMYVFPLVASVENTNWAMLKNALFIGLRYLFCSILLFAIHFAVFFVVVAVFTPILFFGAGLCAILSSYLLNNVIQACASHPEEAALPEESTL